MGSEEGKPGVKRPLAEAGGAAEEEPFPGRIETLEGFQLDSVLSEDSAGKSVSLLGTFKGDSSGSQAIVKLAKRHFPLDKLPGLLSAGSEGGGLRMPLELDFQNDIYSKFAAIGPDEFNAITVDTIYPCTAKHIAKHRTQAMSIRRETPEIYRAFVAPYIASIPTSHIQWVYNILDGKKEADRVLLEDKDEATGFTLLPDLKWDQGQVEQLYCVAIARRRDVGSLRDLTADHLPLLRNVKDASCAVIEEKFGIARSSLKAYVHYHPSYYHLHVHFTHTRLGAIGNGAGKGHLLGDIISNIETFGSDFYQRATLEVEVGDGQAISKCFEQAQEAE